MSVVRITEFARAAALALLAMAGAAGTAGAIESPWERSEFTAVRLISAQSGFDGSGAASLGVQMRLAPGWKIYWRNPGESGLPPSFDWSASTNLGSIDVAWPAPTRFLEIGDLITHGYKDEVVFPLTVRAADPAASVGLHAVINYIACEKVCIPFRAELALDLPPGTAAPTAHSATIAYFLTRVPHAPADGEPTIESAEVAGAGPDRTLRVTARSAEGFSAPEIFVEGPDNFYFAAPAVELGDGGQEAVFRFPALPGRDDAALVDVALTFTLVAGEYRIEQTLTAVPGIADAPQLGALAAIMALAFLGGLILNLMPCVLPVLSLKLMAVVSLAGASRRHIATRFVATAAGIVLSFLALAAAAAAVKAAGVAVGWGVQFQEPLFLVALTIVVTLFACNLWGLFSIPLPAWLGGLGAGGERHETLAGHFASGAFATLLATPCSAPFLGTAVGFALARGTGDIFAVFTALGIGMATPYLAVAVFPGVAARLPRPGPWMAVLRHVLGLLLALTAVWLITILATESGNAAAAAVSGLMIATVIVMWVVKRRGIAWQAGAAAAVVVSVLAFLAPGPLADTPPSEEPVPAGIWQPFERDAIAGLVAEGKTVFVDVTADWCVTCQFNKKTVLERGAVADWLAGEQVVAMRADWTAPNVEIAAYLEEFGRYGIPFNVVYGPALPRGFALPEILTQDSVLIGLNRAGSKTAATE